MASWAHCGKKSKPTAYGVTCPFHEANSCGYLACPSFILLHAPSACHDGYSLSLLQLSSGICPQAHCLSRPRCFPWSIWQGQARMIDPLEESAKADEDGSRAFGAGPE